MFLSHGLWPHTLHPSRMKNQRGHWVYCSCRAQTKMNVKATHVHRAYTTLFRVTRTAAFKVRYCLVYSNHQILDRRDNNWYPLHPRHHSMVRLSEAIDTSSTSHAHVIVSCPAKNSSRFIRRNRWPRPCPQRDPAGSCISQLSPIASCASHTSPWCLKTRFDGLAS